MLPTIVPPVKKEESSNCEEDVTLSSALTRKQVFHISRSHM